MVAEGSCHSCQEEIKPTGWRINEDTLTVKELDQLKHEREFQCDNCISLKYLKYNKYFKFPF